MESESDSTRYTGSQGRRVPSPKEREQAHWFSQPSVCSNWCRAAGQGWGKAGAVGWLAG